MEHPSDCSQTTKYEKLIEQRLVFSKNFLAGGIAGAISRTVVSPLERAKILFQVQNSASVKSTGQQGFDSLAATFSRIIREDGLRGLFKGNGINIIRIIPYSSTQFASYELFLKELNTKLETVERLAAGACAGITAATVTYPLDLARTRHSLVANTQLSLVKTLQNIYLYEGGLFALYRGLLPTLIGIAPLVGINFTVYESLKQQAKTWQNTESISIPQKLACGGVAGATAQTITYPLDVLRRRLQSSALIGFNYSGTADAAIKMYRREGLSSFYRGLLPNYLKVVPAISVSFVIYEHLKALL